LSLIAVEHDGIIAAAHQWDATLADGRRQAALVTDTARWIMDGTTNHCSRWRIFIGQAPIIGALIAVSLAGCGVQETKGGNDPIVTQRSAVLSGPTTFNGLGGGAFPPDTIGDIGSGHFVQMTNATPFQVWDKTGTSVLGPQDMSTLWTTTACATQGLGDPVVVYDHLADRWLLAQFAGSNDDPNLVQDFICLAISRTGTPGGTTADWFVYDFATPNFPDYPKIGVWPDGYYMTTYEFPDLGLYVLDRANLLNGNGGTTSMTCAASGSQCLRTTVSALSGTVRDTRILPADLDGPAPVDAPGIFVRSVDDQQDTSNPVDRLEVYNATVDWTAQTWSVVQQPNLTPAAFNTMACNRNGLPFVRGISEPVRDCIPQPGEDTIDALSNRPMMQLKYRVFPDGARMVFVQTVDVQALFPGVATGEVAGIRWYQLRISDAGWAIQDQGDFSPQNAPTTNAELIHRWMGSAAIDKDGNIAIGYSATNSDTDPGDELFPALFYAARKPTDPVGTLSGETLIAESAGPATNPFGTVGTINTVRWGDYSAMSVDPIDNCTFWFTSHMADFSTRISRFSFTECNNAPVARCRDVTVPANASCQGVVTADQVNDGSSDVDGDPLNCVLSPTGPFALGTTGVTLTCTDPSGAFNACTALVTVVDNTPPVLTCPVSVNVQCTSAAGAVATFATTATDNCGSVGPVVCTPPSGSNFPLGTSVDNCTVNDGRGNSAACSFNVTVALGDNPICCPAGTNIILGTSNNNTLNGTSGSDCILGRGAQDIINGNGGNDFISGGDGDDIINGGGGNDMIFAGTGQDQVTGGPGNDLMSGGDGDDVMSGGDGNDTILGGQGQDRLFGENNNDNLIGETGDDRLEGGAGDDVLNGGGLHDVCIGGPGTDVFLSCQTQTP
jgi:Ca2+-binding RTX toxin-like protein